MLFRSRRLLDHDGTPGRAPADDAGRRKGAAAELLLEQREVVGGGHATRVRGRSTRARGESGGVRKLIVIGVVTLLAVLLVAAGIGFRSGGPF